MQIDSMGCLSWAVLAALNLPGPVAHVRHHPQPLPS